MRRCRAEVRLAAPDVAEQLDEGTRTDAAGRPEQGPSAPPRWHVAVLAVTGLVAGAAAGMNALTGAERAAAVTGGQIVAHVLGGAVIGLLGVFLIRRGTIRAAGTLGISGHTLRRFSNADVFTHLVLLVTLLGAFGVVFVPVVIVAVATALVLLKAAVLYGAMDSAERSAFFSSLGWLAFLFLVSGFAALIYQIVWQRVMFAAFGVNIESITVIVSLFMFGLGLGSLAGGWFAKKYPGRAPLLFLVCEACIGLFGIVSVPLIKWVSGLTLHASLAGTSLAIFALLCVPTMLMGATLPILVSHLYRYYRNVGKSVGILYCINTVGSAIACFITADVLFVFLGEQASVLVAALCNLAVGVLVWLYARRITRNVTPEP